MNRKTTTTTTTTIVGNQVMLIWQSGLKNEGKHTSKDDKVMDSGVRRRHVKCDMLIPAEQTSIQCHAPRLSLQPIPPWLTD